MQVRIANPLAETAAGATAEAVLRACVHCGMCNAVCPTFALAGDERDGPRGRIYLMKGLLEGEAAGEATRRHLDRCLSCRACETACPSGVDYHRLLDVGRERLAEVAPRPLPGRLARAAIRWLAHRPMVLRPLLRLTGRARVPSGRLTTASPLKREEGERRMLLLGGCVQAGAAAHFNVATRRVLGRIGVAVDEAPGCCGAIDAHLEAFATARARARRNVAAWEAALDGGAEALVINASGCAAFVRDYCDLLADEPAWRDRARRIAAAVRDPVEVLEGADLPRSRAPRRRRIAVHDPCTLANGPKLGGRVAALLAKLGHDIAPAAGAPRCCGSAGAGSLLHPRWAKALRRDTLAALTAGDPDEIVTANIGCWLHLATDAPIPVRHWIEVVDETQAAGPSSLIDQLRAKLGGTVRIADDADLTAPTGERWKTEMD